LQEALGRIEDAVDLLGATSHGLTRQR
jgi:hypothetical protein